MRPPAERRQRIGAWWAAAFAASLALGIVAYLAYAVPGSWFPSAPPRTWTPANLVMSAGTGRVQGAEFLVIAPDATNSAIVAVATELRARDYGGVQWIAIDVPEGADVRLLWRSDYAPAKLNSVPLRIEAGRLLPVVVEGHPSWIGRISGLALAMRTPLQNPVRIRGVVAKPLGAAEVLVDRWREWTAFEGWTGTSINAVTGGADIQDLPLPPLLAFTVAIAALVVAGARRWLRVGSTLPLAAGFAAVFFTAWFLLDARWTWNLARQVRSTGDIYAGSDWRAKHLRAPDASLFAFIDRARAQMPAQPARVFVFSDAHYYRGRAAYHLYPHNVYFDPYYNAPPPAAAMRPGDWIVVYQRRGIQYDPAQRTLRWEGGVPVPADLRLTEAGAALFAVR